MKFLIVGLGSMGKRRVRCLHALGYTSVAGFDPREDRRAEAEQKYGIKTFSEVDVALETFSPDAMIISVPPDIHPTYMKLAAERGINFFVEAGVVDDDREEIIALCKERNVQGIPSLTLGFHPALKIVHEIVESQRLGVISNVLYHCGSYLPDWHTYEHVRDYYVSNPVTGGCREIVAFEFSWIVHIFGLPRKVCGHVRKTTEIEGAEKIDDTYNCLLDYEKFLATVTVDVVSRNAVRRLTVNGSLGQLLWTWDEPNVRIFNPDNSKWEVISHETPKAHQGYNENIGEQMYVDELKCFIDSVNGVHKFPNSLQVDHDVLKLVYAIENADKTQTYVQL